VKPVRDVAGALGRAVRFVVLDDFATKVLAFVVAAFLFVAARNEVVRIVEVPVRVVPDPTRVLRSALPAKVEAVVRGPWGAVARLERKPLPPLRLRLSELDPGPLVLDPRDVPLPADVTVQRLVYEPVDLRFEPVVERSVPIEPRIVGVPAKGTRVSETRVSPATWFVRGASSEIGSIEHLWTEPIDVAGARKSFHVTVGLAPPPADVELLRARPSDRPQVDVTVRIDPAAVRRTLTLSHPAGGTVEVTVTVPQDLAAGGEDLASLFEVRPLEGGAPGAVEVVPRPELADAVRIVHVVPHPAADRPAAGPERDGVGRRGRAPQPGDPSAGPAGPSSRE